MPNKPLKPCNHFGCHNLASEWYCDDHKKSKSKMYDAQRLSPAVRGYDARWVAAKNAYLRRNPLCVICKSAGTMTYAICVDHIIPHNGDMKLFWDIKNNWQSLCRHCHSQKTMKDLNEIKNLKGAV